MREQNQLASKSQAAVSDKDPVVVYDRVTKAWQVIMGEDLHFGYFENPQVPLAEATERLTLEMADWAQPPRETRVLDIGCGIGGPALFLAQRTGCRVTGISTSRVGVQTAQQRASAQNASARVEFFERDGMANGFSDEAFDCAWIMESSHLMQKKDRLLADSARVLRPGGILILCDIVVKNAIPFRYLVRNLSEFENLNTVFGKQSVELMSRYLELAETAGLKVLRTADVSKAVFPTLQHWRDNAHAHSAALQEMVGEEYLSRFTRACEFLEKLWVEELLGYGMMLARK